MIFHYAGKYDGDESKLPQKEHHPHAVQFQEPKDAKKLSLIVNIGCVLTMGLLAIPFLLLGIKYISGCGGKVEGYGNRKKEICCCVTYHYKEGCLMGNAFFTGDRGFAKFSKKEWRL